jgi:hypothetical protein
MIIHKEKKCLQCLSPYTPNSGRQKYCNDCCKRGTAVCQQCKKDFNIKAGTSGKFCSRKCSSDYLRSPETQDKKCLFCENLFKPRRLETLFCSRKCWSKYAQNKKEHKCRNCNIAFISKHKHSKFCSKECSGQNKQKSKTTNCENCNNPLPQGNNPVKRFCSQACRSEPVGTKSIGKEGYVKIKINNNQPKSQQWTQEHRYIMEQHLQRTLTKEERVHHKNEIRNDNKLENLELWVLHKNSKKDPAGSRVRDLLEEAINRIKSSQDFLKLPKDFQDNICKNIIGNY